MRPETRLGSSPDDEDARDAVHIAIIPVFAGEKLFPGQDVGILKTTVGGKPGFIAVKSAPHVGIIDPFLKESVPPNARCWLLLYPGSITSLRHDWTHPAFEEAK